MKKIHILCILFIVFLISVYILQESNNNTLTWTTQKIGNLDKYNITQHYTEFHNGRHIIINPGEKITVSFNTPFSDTEPIFDKKNYSIRVFGILYDYDNWVQYVIEANNSCIINAKSDAGEFKLYVHLSNETPKIGRNLKESKNLLLDYIKEQNGMITNVSFRESKKVEPYHYKFTVLYMIPSDNYTVYGTKAEVIFGNLQFGFFWSEPEGHYLSRHGLHIYPGHKTIMYHILPVYYIWKAKTTTGSVLGYIDPSQKSCELSNTLPDEILSEPIHIFIKEEIGLENVYYSNDTTVEFIDDYYDSSSFEDDFLDIHHHFILKLNSNNTQDINFTNENNGTIKCHIPLRSEFPVISWKW